MKRATISAMPLTHPSPPQAIRAGTATFSSLRTPEGEVKVVEPV